MESNVEQGFVFQQPRAFEERRDLARILPERLEYRLPLAIDALDDRAEKAYAAWPERIYVVGPDGRIVYKAQPGPFGFKPEEAEASLERLLNSNAARLAKRGVA